MELSEGENINIGKGSLFIPNKEGVDIHGKTAYLKYGWGKMDEDLYGYSYFVPLRDIKKVDSNSLLKKYILQDINFRTRAKRTLTGGLKITHKAPYENSISIIKFSKKQYNKIRQYF